MKKSKSKIIIISVLVVVILVIVIGLYLFFKTDLLKSKKDLFFKYIAQNNQLLEIVDNNNDSIKQLKNNKYKTEGTISFDLVSSEEAIANQALPARNFAIQYVSKSDPVAKKESNESTLKYLNQDIFTLKYLRNQDLYGVKSDELVNFYLVFNNNNIQEYVKKMGIENANVPNKIETSDFEQLFMVDHTIMQEIGKRYAQLLKQNIKSESYEKQNDAVISRENNNMVTNAYAVNLSGMELKEITKLLLQAVKEDKQMLSLLIEKIGKLDNSLKTEEQIQTKIDELLVNTTNIPEDDKLQIIVYEKEQKLIRTQLQYNNDSIVVDFYEKENAKQIKINIKKQEVPEDSYEIQTITLEKKMTEGKSELIMALTLQKGEELAQIAIQTNPEVEIIDGKMQNTAVVNFNLSNKTYFTATINQNITLDETIEIENLTNNNSTIINEFTPEYTGQVLAALLIKGNFVYTQKMQIINQLQQNSTNSTETSQNTESTNNLINGLLDQNH